MKTFVATNPENGWDCVIGVFQAETAEEVTEYIWRAAGYAEEPEDYFLQCVVHPIHIIINLSEGTVSTLAK